MVCRHVIAAKCELRPTWDFFRMHQIEETVQGDCGQHKAWYQAPPKSRMPSGALIDSIFSLATVPRPIDSSNGRILASTVHSLTHSKKRKRSQLAVSVDGEGVNIYSVGIFADVGLNCSDIISGENTPTSVLVPSPSPHLLCYSSMFSSPRGQHSPTCMPIHLFCHENVAKRPKY